VRACHRHARLLAAVATTTLLAACPTVRVPELRQAPLTGLSDSGGAPLKVHLMSGELLVLETWRDAPGDTGLTGAGLRYDARRRLAGGFIGTVPRDSVALLEITRAQTARPAGSVVLGTFTVLMGAVTALCVADPKTCFGSCPTFYLDGDDRPVAEGFSASVARVLEATDVDHLAQMAATGRQVAITMRNEALETHAIRAVRLLVAPRPAGGRIVHAADGTYFAATDDLPPATCIAADRDCRAVVAAADGAEWSTTADRADLGAPDSVDLVFPGAAGPGGLLVTARQSFVSTYVFYQTLAYAGSRAGDLLAEVERRGTAAFPGAWAMMRHLSRVEVLAGPTDGALEPVGAFGEPGPIAADHQVVPLPAALGHAPLRVRLRFTRGAWRFDRLALARIAPAAQPQGLDPTRVERAGTPEAAALARLLDPDRYLITGPGDAYRLTFDLPRDASELEFFLESRGYYYEWMRPEWLREEDPAMLRMIAHAPRAALRRMAPGYARLEPRLEELFWASRFGRR